MRQDLNDGAVFRLFLMSKHGESGQEVVRNTVTYEPGAKSCIALMNVVN